MRNEHLRRHLVNVLELLVGILTLWSNNCGGFDLETLWNKKNREISSLACRRLLDWLFRGRRWVLQRTKWYSNFEYTTSSALVSNWSSIAWSWLLAPCRSNSFPTTSEDKAAEFSQACSHARMARRMRSLSMAIIDWEVDQWKKGWWEGERLAD